MNIATSSPVKLFNVINSAPFPPYKCLRSNMYTALPPSLSPDLLFLIFFVIINIFLNLRIRELKNERVGRRREGENASAMMFFFPPSIAASFPPAPLLHSRRCGGALFLDRAGGFAGVGQNVTWYVTPVQVCTSRSKVDSVGGRCSLQVSKSSVQVCVTRNFGLHEYTRLIDQ